MIYHQEMYQFVIDHLTRLSIRHESHEFASGAAMLDIWYKDLFFVIQFEKDFIGLSEVESHAEFDAIPDKKFLDDGDFEKEIRSVFL